MAFERIPGSAQGSELDRFKVIITVEANHIPVTGAEITATVNEGARDKIIDNNDGTYQFTVTPETTGEYEISVSYEDQILTHTALVLQGVNDLWGQPMAVPGYVNTAGYEDGAFITPDGEYLFVQTGPYRWSSLLVFSEPVANGGCGGNRLVPDRCDHPWINEITGTITAPERPDFYIGRFSGTTQLHNAASWGIEADGLAQYALTTLFYGFKRQDDGSFKEPFYLGFNDLYDGITGPFGLSLMDNGDGTYTTIFSLKDAATTDGGFDVYTYTADLGTHNNFGDYVLSHSGYPPDRGAYFPSTLVDFGNNSGTQGNPFLYHTGSTIRSIWTDDEYDSDEDTQKLTVYVMNSGNFPTSNDWEKVLLPENINHEGKGAIQPFFTGSGLYFTQETNIVFSSYSGIHTPEDLMDNANWSVPVTILEKDTTIDSLKVERSDIGKIVALGEPSIAHRENKQILYFVYAYIRGIDTITGYADLDFQVGYVKKNGEG